MKFRTRPEAEKAAKLLGQPVEWVRRNYGAQRELTWNIRISDGTEIHNWSQIGMPEETLNQVVTELQQVRAKITDLDAQLSSRRQKAKGLADKLAGMVSETLPSGCTMEIKARDGLSVSPASKIASTPPSTRKPISNWPLNEHNERVGVTEMRDWYKGLSSEDKENVGSFPDRGTPGEKIRIAYAEAKGFTLSS